jgi:hypothetical protein
MRQGDSRIRQRFGLASVTEADDAVNGARDMKRFAVWAVALTVNIAAVAFVGPLALAVTGVNGEPKCAGKAPTIVGTAGDDVLTGTAAPDVIAGLGATSSMGSTGTTPSAATPGWTRSSAAPGSTCSGAAATTT